jgi:NADH-quinone oxidoreductase subunit J
VGPGLLAVILAAELIYTLAISTPVETGYALVTPKQVGQRLFGVYFIGLELASLLLLAGLVGALHLAHTQRATEIKGTT